MPLIASTKGKTELPIVLVLFRRTVLDIPAFTSCVLKSEEVFNVASYF